jgi:hypothetical protein
MSRPTFNLGAFLEIEKLKTNGSNFTTWFHTLRIILAPHRMGYVLHAAIGAAPSGDASNDVKNIYQTKVDDASFVQSGMLFAMESDLQKRFEKMSAFEIITNLKVVFAPQAWAERYEASELFFSSHMDKHSSVSEHVVKMSGYVQRLNTLECKISDELAIDRVLQSLPPSYKGFVMNYNMQEMTKSLSELFSMLKTAEVVIKKEHNVLLVNKTTDFKKSGKSKKGPQGKKPKRDGQHASGPPKAPKMKPGVKCFYYKGDGHWKLNCPKYLEDNKAGKVVARNKGIFDIHVIDIYLTSACSNTWVFDTSSVANICNS